MFDKGIDTVAQIAALAFALAAVAVIFSNKANSSQVFDSIFNGIATIIGKAVSPVTGGN